MKAVGATKILSIVILAVVSGLIFLYTFQYLKPDLLKKTRSLQANDAEIGKMVTDLNDLKSGLEKFETQKQDFETIQKLGFFDSQNRVEAKTRIDIVQRESRLINAKYTIRPAENLSNDKVKEAGYKLLSTGIDFDLEAIEDADIYKFIYLLNYGFPGQIVIDGLDMSRDIEITQPLLRKIGVGQVEPIIKGRMNVRWLTMVPDETLAVSTEGQVQNNGGAQ